ASLPDGPGPCGAPGASAHRTLPARNPRPSGRGGAPISMVDSPRVELSTRSASGPGENQAVGPLRQPSKRRWGWTGRLPRSQAGRRTVDLEPQGQALGLKHGLLSPRGPGLQSGRCLPSAAGERPPAPSQGPIIGRARFGWGRPARASPPGPRSFPRRWPPAEVVPSRQAFPLGTPGGPSAPSRGLRPEPGQNLVQHARELIGHLATLPLVALGLGPEPLDLVAELVALALDGLHATLQASVLVDH